MKLFSNPVSFKKSFKSNITWVDDAMSRLRGSHQLLEGFLPNLMSSLR
jgi:hypothetical protein